MSLKQKYLDAMKNNDHDKLLILLIKNLICDFNYKSISDLGTYLCDVDNSGIKLELDEKECVKLGEILISYSYRNHPDTCNAFALQSICLEKSSNFQLISEMESSAMLLNNALIINNIAFAKFKLNLLVEAIELQKIALEIGSDDNIEAQILQYNSVIYNLFSGVKTDNDFEYQKILNMLISDDVFDYESAVILAICFNDLKFVKENLEILESTFVYGLITKKIINDYLNSNKVPEIENLIKVLSPKTMYGKGFYFV